MSNFMNIRPVGAELLHVDGRTDERTDRQTDTHTHTYAHTHTLTDMTKLIVAFRNFVITPLKFVLLALHNLRSSVLRYKLAGLT